MKNRHTELPILAMSALLLIAAGAPAARAADLPAARSATLCDFDGNAGTGDPIQCAAGPGGSAKVTFAPVATSFVEGTGDGHSERSSAELVYYFMIVGGNPGDAYVQQKVVGAGQAFADDISYSGDLARVGYVGHVYEVDQYTQMATAAGNAGVARAMVDPYIHIDPAFANAGLYSIVVSAGIGNEPVGAVPEPSSWSLLALGVAGLVLRRRRRLPAG